MKKLITAEEIREANERADEAEAERLAALPPPEPRPAADPPKLVDYDFTACDPRQFAPKPIPSRIGAP